MSTQLHPVNTSANRNDGAWLCAEGPYLNFISRMNDLNPGMGLPDPKNEYIGSRVGQSRSVVLELKPDVTWSCRTFQSASEVKNHLRQIPSAPMQATNSRKRIYILEGLDPQYVEAYGSHFFMDPSFFVRHERNDLFNLKRSEFHIHDPPPLPSLKHPENYFRVKYREIRQFGPQLRDWRTTCALTGRHISAIGFEGKLDTAGSIARKFSFWSQKHADDGWDVVILCDPPIRKVHRHGLPAHTEQFQSEPFQGGYHNFTSRTTDNSRPRPLLEAPPRTSLLDDLCFFYEHYPTTLTSSEYSNALTTPLTAAVLPMKIICAHYMKLADYFEVILYRLARTEWQLSRQSDYADYKYPEVEEQWSSLQLTRVRLSTCIDDVDEILSDTDISPSQSGVDPTPTDWYSIHQDLRFIHQRLQKMKARVDEAIASAMGLSSIVGSKQSLSEARRSVKEAKSTKTLTVVGLVFIPLAYTCALFSMSDSYRPGSRLFYVYIAVCIPFIALVFLGTFLIQLGYDDNASWSWTQFRKAFRNLS